jgi:hypothetical protein
MAQALKHCSNLLHPCNDTKLTYISSTAISIGGYRTEDPKEVDGINPLMVGLCSRWKSNSLAELVLPVKPFLKDHY